MARRHSESSGSQNGETPETANSGPAASNGGRKRPSPRRLSRQRVDGSALARIVSEAVASPLRDLISRGELDRLADGALDVSVDGSVRGVRDDASEDLFDYEVRVRYRHVPDPQSRRPMSGPDENA